MSSCRMFSSYKGQKREGSPMGEAYGDMRARMEGVERGREEHNIPRRGRKGVMGVVNDIGVGGARAWKVFLFFQYCFDEAQRFLFSLLSLFLPLPSPCCTFSLLTGIFEKIISPSRRTNPLFPYCKRHLIIPKWRRKKKRKEKTPLTVYYAQITEISPLRARGNTIFSLSPRRLTCPFRLCFRSFSSLRFRLLTSSPLISPAFFTCFGTFWRWPADWIPERDEACERQRVVGREAGGEDALHALRVVDVAAVAFVAAPEADGAVDVQGAREVAHVEEASIGFQLMALEARRTRERSVAVEARMEVSVWLRERAVMVSIDVGQARVWVGVEDGRV
ncbi:hypothetical protein KC330_g217 [Hortaea werneckii]|nr:hypothetical protein KC330_g217 [Hortaea werneckii]